MVNAKLKLWADAMHRLWFGCFIGLFVLFTVTAANATGFRHIHVEDMQFGLWYPSDHEGTRQRLGPFELTIAKDAPAAKGRYDIILFSHGRQGYYRNHYLTIQSLVDAGYVVISPQHQADGLIGGDKTAQSLNHRYQELATALDALKSGPEFSAIINPEMVHGIGYSLGSATILMASGAGYNPALRTQYCDENRNLDPEFCDVMGTGARIPQFFDHENDLPNASGSFRHLPLITGKSIVIAPVFQGLDLRPPLSMAEVTIIAIENDKITKARFHARPLFEGISQQIPTHYKVVSGHHFAFIAPFPKWLTDIEDSPIAKDPIGFDRVMFLDKVNHMILDALQEGM